MWNKRSDESVGDNDDFLEDLYKSVAELDPEWYEDFVKNILADDEVPYIPKGATPSAAREENSSTQIKVNEIGDVDGSLPFSEETSSNPGRETNDINLIENPTHRVDELLAQLQMEETESNGQKEDISVTGSYSEVSVLMDDIESDQSMQVPEEMDVNTLPPASKVVETSVDFTNTAVPLLNGGENNLVVVYRDFHHKTLRSVPLTMLTDELEYDKDEIPYMQPDALDLIIRDGIRKPLRGVPQQWKISQNQYEYLGDDVRIVTSEQARVLMEAKDKDRQAKLQDTYTKPLIPGLTSSKQHDMNSKFIKRASEAWLEEDKTKQPGSVAPDEVNTERATPATEIPVDVDRTQLREDKSIADGESSNRLKNNEQDVSRTLPRQPVTATSTTKSSKGVQQELKRPSDESEQVVLFTDRSSRKTQTIRLSMLEDLGYLPEDIVNLDPEALSWIVQDEIEKPRSGIPSDWKQTPGQQNEQLKEVDSIRVVSRAEAQRIMESSMEARVSAVSQQRQDDIRLQQDRDTVKDAVKSPPKRDAAVRSQDRTTRRRNDGLYGDERRNRERQHDDAAMKESSKRIYSGRDVKRPPDASRRKSAQDNPPRPRLWPDFDTFRDLLRDEAELRLRILGNGWTDAVREEVDWRLGLYREWLWTLHNGIGEPVVPSRRERERIRRNMNEFIPLSDPPPAVVDDPPRRRRSETSRESSPVSDKTIGDNDERRPRRSDRTYPRISRRQRDERIRDE